MSLSPSLTPAAGQLLVRLALAVPYRDGWRLTPVGLRRYRSLSKSPLQREKLRPVIDDILDRAIPLARAKAETLTDRAARDSMLNAADTWDRMAAWEDKVNPKRPVPGK